MNSYAIDLLTTECCAPLKKKKKGSRTLTYMDRPPEYDAKLKRKVTEYVSCDVI